MRIVDDLIGDGQCSGRESGADAANGRDRDDVRDIQRMQRPDIGAVVHLVRGYGVAVAVAGEKYDFPPLDRAECHSAGRLAVGGPHDLPPQVLEDINFAVDASRGALRRLS